MTQTKKKTLIVLGITLLLLLAFIISMTIGQNAVIASADSTSFVNSTQQTLDGVMSNGKAPATTNTNGTAIYTREQLQDFLQNGKGRGYIASDNIDFYWDDYQFTRRLMSEEVTELDGNGHTITLLANKLQNSRSSPEIGVADGDNKSPTPYTVERTRLADEALMTYAGTKDTQKNLDLYAGLIGYLRPNQTIKNCNFVYNQKEKVELSYNTRNSGSFGLIVAYSLGTIDNCSLNIGSDVSFYAGTDWTGSVTNYGQESMSKHSYAMGGFVGTMSTNAKVSNSKIILNGNLSISATCKNSGGAGKGSYRDDNSRTWAGGIVGWMANGSQVYNIVTEGKGHLDARTDNDDETRGRSFAGIIAGISGGDNVLDGNSVAGKVDSCGIINGVINNWEGVATYLSNDPKYSPIDPKNGKENSIQYLIIGFAGLETNPTQIVSDIFMNKDVYKGNTFSIGYDCATDIGYNGASKGRYYSTNVLIKDVLGQNDGSENYTTANNINASLAFSGTEISSPLWAVYDLKDNDVILWSKSVTNTTTNAQTMEYYYDQATSIEDAKKFKVTHTEIKRGSEANYEIKYAHGKAVYFKKIYPNKSDLKDPNNVIMPEVKYGEGLSAPRLELYYDEKCTNYIETLEDKSYWVSISGSSNVPVRMTDGIVSADTYKSFIYLDSPVGRDYSYIQFLNATFRYVSYIYDDPNFKNYQKDHPGYEPVRNGEKQIDWQQRAVQTVTPKIASINWGYGSDITKVKDIESDPLGNVTSFGRFKTLYDGDPVVFDIAVPLSTLLSGDVCAVNYEYQMQDTHTGKYIKVDSCVNAGTYKIVVTGLSNRNYTLSGASEYCIYFEIEKRQIGLINKLDADMVGDDTYHIKRTYEGKEINLKDEIDICLHEYDAKVSSKNIVLFNVLDKDSKILKFDNVAYGDSELNMRNVGMFEMRISLLGGIISSNYILPDVTKYIIEIVEAEATFSTQTSFEYYYGYLVKDQVNVTVTGVDGEMSFDSFTYYKQQEDGKYKEVGEEPFDVGVYQIKYDFLNASYPNFKSHSVLVDVVILQRKVSVKYTDEQNPTELKTNYNYEGIDSIKVEFNRQTDNNGIIAYEYNDYIPTFKFRKLDANGNPTDEVVDVAVDVGKYWVEVGIDFKTGITPTGWVINDRTKDNYQVISDIKYSLVINPKNVYIELKDGGKTYGDDVVEPVGEATASEEVRAWKYADGYDENYFYGGDDIVVLPILSDKIKKFAFVGDYDIIKAEEGDRTHLSDKAHILDSSLTTYNKIDNYVVNFINEKAKYTISPRIVKVNVYIDTTSVVYGEGLPKVVDIQVYGENDFFEQDNIVLEEFWGEIATGSPVGRYEVSAIIKQMENDADKNYQLDVNKAEFEILKKTITITSSKFVGNQNTFQYNGKPQSPEVDVTFAGELFEGDTINFKFNYFEVINGEVSTEATENPQNVGIYRVYIAGADNKNYDVVFDKDYERKSLEIEITKIDVRIEVLPAYIIYSLENSLTSEGEAFKFVNGTGFYGIDTSKGTLYLDEYYQNLGKKEGVVKIRFDELLKDANSVDANGEWIIGEEVQGNGEIIFRGYRNYNIIIKCGDLQVLSGNLEEVDKYISLRSYEQKYNGQDRYKDFEVLTSNENIANALKFSVFQYVEISSLSKSEADSLANAYGKYVQIEEGGKITYVQDDENGTYVRKFFRRVENGDSVSDKIVDAGQYFLLITPADENAGIFQGESTSISFVITKSERELSKNDLIVTVNYNQISISSKIDAIIEISVDGGEFTRNNTFEAKSETKYIVKVRFAETDNYLQSQEIELELQTGFDISVIQSAIKKFDKIDFSNIVEYESKVIALIDKVSEADMKLIDQEKLAILQASYEQLLRGVNSVVEGAQKVGATAVGKSGKTAGKAVAMALSTSGLGLLAAGIMLFAKKRNDEEVQETKKVKTANAKRASKVAVAIIAVMLVCVTVFAFAGCEVKDEQGFGKADLYKIASYQGHNQDLGNRDLTIEVKSGGMTLYKYANGKETVDKRLNVSSIKFGENGVGFEFDDLYFENMQFEKKENVATFKADIKETLAFLGVESAKNGKVSVVVDTQKKQLESLDVSYDVVSAGITYNVTINVKVK